MNVKSGKTFNMIERFVFECEWAQSCVFVQCELYFNASFTFYTLLKYFLLT